MTNDLDRWAQFFAHEKLVKNIDDKMSLVTLAQTLVAKGARPYYKPYMKRVETRILLVNTAMDLGIDLAKFRVGRALLDTWNEQYKIRFGSTIGTPGWQEAKRRDIKTKLSKDI